MNKKSELFTSRDCCSGKAAAHVRLQEVKDADIKEFFLNGQVSADSMINSGKGG
jgi:hypothetical protein